MQNGHPLTEANGTRIKAHYDLDVLIVGAGFAGVYLLHQLRKEGLKAKIVEAGTGLGGVWHWNSYPGARTDTPVPTYALNIPEVYETWTWSEEYPGDKELKAYFRHIDNVLDISRDVIYNEKLNKATFDATTNKWHLATDRGTTFTAQFFCPCMGFASKRYTPDWPGLEQYKGRIVHPSLWPAEGIDMRGKNVAVVGTGATGVQVAQEAAKEASHLTCFVRTPNLSWPMGQKEITPEQAEKDRPLLKYQLGEKRFTTVGGFLYEETTRQVMDDTPEEREARLSEVYKEGGFKIFFCAYINVLGDQEGNDEIYKFWRRKTHERMTDKKKAEILAPAKPPHPFAGKRPSLEQDYYEQMDKPHVTLVDVKSHPIIHAVPEGLVTADGNVHKADILVLATGYDAVTGGFNEIDITGLHGLTLEERWKDATHSYLGMMVSGFPNMLYVYGPLSPSSYATGPAVVESQAHWILDTMRKMKEQGATRIDTTQEAERGWREKINAIHAWTLRDDIEGSWYLGLNVPGKRREVLLWGGGLPMYRKEIWDAISPEWMGFTLC
ncbi:flavin-containing monooxygenase [Aspergillus undulatus]|uniref:flavin-containing monooxygenase n=1 Tax=Aspergillus undulatus TaxID=1810928 RepID=UPI003CCD82EB